MARALVVVAALAGTAFAKPTVLRAKVSNDENIHIGHEEGAINRHTAVAIRVTLDGKAARVTATGTDVDDNLYVNGTGSSYNTKEETDWTTTWKGSFKYAKQELHLDLTLQKHACKHWKETAGAPVEKLACQTPTAHALLTCVQGTVDIELREPDDGTTAVRVWTCSPDEKTELGETPAPWTLGQSTCLEQNAGPGRGGGSFQPCGSE